MIIGVPTEVKTREYRIGMIPAGVRQLVSHGHKVLVQANAGVGSGLPDEEFVKAGAEIVATADEVWKRAEMIFKVKEPLPEEYPRMREGQIVFAFGKLRGRPLREVARVERDYLEWILKQDFPDDARALVERALRGEA